jgi:hypothetical protein
LFSDEGELAFLNSLIAFARQMNALKLSDTEFALLSALVLLNSSKSRAIVQNKFF